MTYDDFILKKIIFSFIKYIYSLNEYETCCKSIDFLSLKKINFNDLWDLSNESCKKLN